MASDHNSIASNDDIDELKVVIEEPTEDELNNLDDDAVIEKNPLEEMEKEAVKEEEISVPVGFEHTDPGVIDEEQWGVNEWERGASGRHKEEDIESMGMHIEDDPADRPINIDDSDSNTE